MFMQYRVATASSMLNQQRMIPINLLQTCQQGYHDNVIDHYEKPRNVGSFDKKDPKVGTGLVGAPACGDVMRLQIKVKDDGTIEKAVFKVNFMS